MKRDHVNTVYILGAGDADAGLQATGQTLHSGPLDWKAHPGRQEILLIVKVAETSAEVDREVKLPLYARAGIPEVWLVVLAHGSIEIYRDPSPQKRSGNCSASKDVSPTP